MIATVNVPELQGLFEHADHVDVHTTEANVSLRAFVAGALGSKPGWIKGLYAARSVLARALRLNDPDIPVSEPPRPEEISFAPGGKVGFFTVRQAAEDRYLVLEAADNHLTGYLAIVAEPVTPGRNRFQVVTIVKYHRWTGPLYFNLIRPFHHLVVRSMVKAGTSLAPY